MQQSVLCILILCYFDPFPLNYPDYVEEIMDIRNNVIKILSDKKARQTGLHVKHITRHILNMNNNLFSGEENLSFESLKEKVNRMLLYDVRKKKGSQFVRVINPKTKKYRKGIYKMK